MATKTGVVKSIATNRKSAEIIQDADGSIIGTKDVLSTLETEDGVSYQEEEGGAIDLAEITKVKTKGTLTDDETKLLAALISSINKRGGGGGIQINIKTKM